MKRLKTQGHLQGGVGQLAKTVVRQKYGHTQVGDCERFDQLMSHMLEYLLERALAQRALARKQDEFFCYLRWPSMFGSEIFIKLVCRGL